MSLSEPLNISIWRQPHHGWGHIIHIGDGLAGDLPGGFFQSLGVKHARLPELIPDYPVQAFSVSPEALAALAGELDNSSYSFEQHPFTPMLSGEIYGIRVSRGYQEFVVVWQGRFEDQDAQIKSIIGLWNGWRGGQLRAAQSRAYIPASRAGKHDVVNALELQQVNRDLRASRSCWGLLRGHLRA